MKSTLICLVILIVSLSAFAEDNSAKEKQTENAQPKSEIVLENAVLDIIWFDTFTPFKFDKDQITLLLTSLKDVKVKYEELDAKHKKALNEYKKIIIEQRKNSVDSKIASKEFWEKLDKVKAVNDKERDELYAVCVKDVAKALKPTLKQSQRDMIIIQSKETLKAEKNPALDKATEDQLIWLFVERMLMKPEVISRLEELLKQAKVESPKETDASATPVLNSDKPVEEPKNAPIPDEPK